MDRGAWWATVHGGHKESDTIEVTQRERVSHSAKPLQRAVALSFLGTDTSAILPH